MVSQNSIKGELYLKRLFLGLLVVMIILIGMYFLTTNGV
ncbi:hypothetical protein BN1002_01973 [Bacillus sp. B-jedd]|nr:hypothetical protein BN1002_01973 [Bacillus sp. B-jedd]